MRITKFGHSCVRIEHDGVVVVIDPGCWTDPAAVEAADAVLVTHEHVDHLFPDNLRATTAPVYTIEAVAAQIREQAPDVVDRVSVVAPGDNVDVGLSVEVIGHDHAVIHPDFPRFANSGYAVTAGDQVVYHPGDSFTLPERDVDLLCLPVHAPWNKISEVVDFGRAVKAPRALAMHDALLSELGLDLVGRVGGGLLGSAGVEYVRLEPGSDLD